MVCGYAKSKYNQEIVLHTYYINFIHTLLFKKMLIHILLKVTCNVKYTCIFIQKQ